MLTSVNQRPATAALMAETVSIDSLDAFKRYCRSILSSQESDTLPRLVNMNGHLTVLHKGQWRDYGFTQDAIFMGKRLLFADDVIQARLYLDTNFFLDSVL